MSGSDPNGSVHNNGQPESASAVGKNFAPDATSTPFSPVSLIRRRTSREKQALSLELSNIEKSDDIRNGSANSLATAVDRRPSFPVAQDSNGDLTCNTEDILARHRESVGDDSLPVTAMNLDASSQSLSSTEIPLRKEVKRLSSCAKPLQPSDVQLQLHDVLDGKVAPESIEMNAHLPPPGIMSPDDPRVFFGTKDMIVPSDSVRVGMAPNRPRTQQPPQSSHTASLNPNGPGGNRPKFERMHSGRIPVAPFDEGDETDLTLARKYPYQLRDMIMTGWSIGSYIWDYITDWIVAAALFYDKDYWWFGWTVAFIVIPHLVMSCFSLAWYIQDYKHHPNPEGISARQWVIRIVIIVLQLAPVLRYIDSIRYGFKFRRSQHKALYESLCFENADAAMLRLFEAFMEAAPQLILQIYILAKKQVDVADCRRLFDENLTVGNASLTTMKTPTCKPSYTFSMAEIFQIVSIFASWCSIATAIASYHRAQRFSQLPKKQMSIAGSIMQFLWHLFVIASRVIAIALFTQRFNFWGPVFCAAHIIMMLIWILSMKTDFCPNRPLELIYNACFACVYLFAFLNVKDAPTKWKYAFYYTLYYVENIVLISLWYTHMHPFIYWFREPAVAAVIVGVPIGILGFMLPYYYWLHPDRGVFVKRRRQQKPEERNEPRWRTNLLDFCL